MLTVISFTTLHYPTPAQHRLDTLSAPVSRPTRGHGFLENNKVVHAAKKYLDFSRNLPYFSFAIKSETFYNLLGRP